MSYNPDEIVKLKHLNEFAAQLNAKIDRKQKPARTTNTNINKVAYDESFARVPLSALNSSNDFRNNSFQFPSKVPICPRLVDLTVTDGDTTVSNSGGSGSETFYYEYSAQGKKLASACRESPYEKE